MQVSLSGQSLTFQMVRRLSVAVVVIFTALMHFPAVALGPIVEHLQMVQ